MPRVPYQDGFARVSGIRLHYVDYGGQGQNVVALPGLIQSAHAFDSIAPLLAPHVRLLALDFRGRGASDWGPPERYRIDQYLRDLNGFLAVLRLERVALIGTSLGGFVARLFATAHPDRVTRLVLNDCAIGGSLAGVCRVSERPSQAPQEFTDIDEAVTWFQSDRPGLDRLEPVIRREWVMHYLTQTGSGAFRLSCDPAVVRLANSLASQFMMLERPSIETELAWEQARRLTMPLLILRGALSEVIAHETAERLTRLLPNARCVEVAGVTHSPTLYEEEAQRALLEFFGISAAPDLSYAAQSIGRR
jgi:pimeloyl-ACP methyl ester carboxylesterase